MYKLLILGLLFLSCVTNVQAEKKNNDIKNAITTNLLGLATTFYNIGYERAVFKKVAVKVDVWHFSADTDSGTPGFEGTYTNPSFLNKRIMLNFHPERFYDGFVIGVGYSHLGIKTDGLEGAFTGVDFKFGYIKQVEKHLSVGGTLGLSFLDGDDLIESTIGGSLDDPESFEAGIVLPSMGFLISYVF